LGVLGIVLILISGKNPPNSETYTVLEELLVQGLAKLKQDNCPNQSSLETAKTIAKQNKIGVWK
jgi:hypothetical protein